MARVAVLSMVMMGAVLLASCGGEETGEGAQPSPTVGTTTATPEERYGRWLRTQGYAASSEFIDIVSNTCSEEDLVLAMVVRDLQEESKAQHDAFVQGLAYLCPDRLDDLDIDESLRKLVQEHTSQE